jgi:hypothetical protein
LSARETSPTCAFASGTSALMRVLLPVPEGPRTSVLWPAMRGMSRARAASRDCASEHSMLS